LLYGCGLAHLDVSGIDVDNTNDMSDETKQYLSDICSTALYAIGDNVSINTETRTVPPSSSPVVIDTSNSEQEATQTSSAPSSSVGQGISPSGQSEGSTTDQIILSPTISSSEATSLVSEANITESIDGEDTEGIEEEETTTTSSTLSSIGSSSTIGVGLLPDHDDTVVDGNSNIDVDDSLELELEEDTEESDTSNSTEDTSKGIVDKSTGGEEVTTDGDGLSVGAIIGIVIAVVVVVVPLAIVYLGHRRRQQQQGREELARMESTLEHAGKGALRRDSGSGSGGSGTRGTVQPLSPSRSATGSDYIGTP